MKLYFGCDQVKRWDRYVDECNLLEVPFPDDGKPTLKTLNRWRVKTPRGFAFVVRASPAIGDWVADMRLGTDALESALEATEEVAAALAAKAVLVKTPTGIFPSETSKTRLAELAEAYTKKSKRLLFLETSGPWPLEETRAWAREHGYIYVHDPFLAQQDEIPFEKGTVAFSVTERAGMRRHFDDYDFELLLDEVESCERVFLLLRGRFRLRHAKELRAIVEF